MLVEKFTIHILSAPHKRGIFELKEYYAHILHGPIKLTQGVM